LRKLQGEANAGRLVIPLSMLSAGFTTSWPFRGKEELTDFLEHFPTQRVTTSLKHQ
jgi:hypothetical protein